MGGPVIETIRPGVQFVPEAARAFRRAEARVRAEFGRDIDVNSTYRDWDTQLAMYNAWQAYVSGRGPHPGHSKALHPDDPLAFHTKGLALDSDDWTNQRIVQILAEHGFIRNRLYVPNENHHFEYLRDHDKHINDPVPSLATVQHEENDMAFPVNYKGHKFLIGLGQIKHFTAENLPDFVMRVATTEDEWHQPKNAAEWVALLDGFGIPREVVGEDGAILNPQTGKHVRGGMWSWAREASVKADRILAAVRG